MINCLTVLLMYILYLNHQIIYQFALQNVVKHLNVRNWISFLIITLDLLYCICQKIIVCRFINKQTIPVNLEIMFNGIFWLTYISDGSFGWDAISVNALIYFSHIYQNNFFFTIYVHRLYNLGLWFLDYYVYNITLFN